MSDNKQVKTEKQTGWVVILENHVDRYFRIEEAKDSSDAKSLFFQHEGIINDAGKTIVAPVTCKLEKVSGGLFDVAIPME